MLLAVLSGTSVLANWVLIRDGHIHFHILFIVPKQEGDTYNDCLQLQSVMFKEVLKEWKRNVAQVWSKKKQCFIPDTRRPDWKPLCTYVRKMIRGRIRSNFDLHYVSDAMSDGGSADVCFYVMKYMLKPSSREKRLQQALHLNLSDEEYHDVWSLVRSRHFESEGLGLGSGKYVKTDFRRHYLIPEKVLEYLKRGVSLSKHNDDVQPYASFYSPLTGKQFPLARYYKNNPDIFDMQDYLDFFYADKVTGADNIIISEKDALNQLVSRIDDFDKTVQQVDFRQTAVELDELFEEFDSDGFFYFD